MYTGMIKKIYMHVVIIWKIKLRMYVTPNIIILLKCPFYLELKDNVGTIGRLIRYRLRWVTPIQIEWLSKFECRILTIRRLYGSEKTFNLR